MVHELDKFGLETLPLTRDLPIETVRLCFAEGIRVAARIRLPAVAKAFAAIPRERFLSPGPWSISRFGTYTQTESSDPRYLYHDVMVAIDLTRKLNNGLPSSHAEWMDALELLPSDRVLHVGCGLGYYTAIIAEIVTPAGRVTAIEIDPDLAARARTNLANTSNVTVIETDGVSYDPGDVDVIYVNVGVSHPEPLWLDRLQIGGRLLVPLTAIGAGFESIEGSGSAGLMLLVRKVRDGYYASFIGLAGFYPSPTGRNMAYNLALGKLLREAILGKRSVVRVVRRDFHTADDTCWFHGDGFCISMVAENKS
jgi:protein-L-isoaspartate(D-aspartate) O-methyltransferase